MKKRNVMMLIVLMVIGFAAVSTTLVLNGTIGIGANQDDFDVIFTSATIDGEGASATIDETKKKITFTSSKLASINEESVLNYEIKNNSTQYDADLTINCTSDASEYIKVTNELEGEEITENYKTTFNAQETKSGVITSKLIKSSIQESASISITCEIVASATERDSAVEIKNASWTISEDNDNNGVLSKGDLITIDTESFYVYDIEGDKVSAIAQYNLYVGNSCPESNSSSCTALENSTGLQDSRAIGYGITPRIGVVPFTTNEKYNSVTEGITENIPNKNDYSISTIKEYVDEYANKLSDLNAYVDAVRLITKEELEAAGCDSSRSTCKSAPEYLYSTSYWTSSPNAVNVRYVWIVSSNGIFGNDNVLIGSVLGVRPVVELSASLF